VNRLRSWTARLDVTPDLVSVLEEIGAYVWVREGEGFAAWSRAASFDPGTGEQRFASAASWLDEAFTTASIHDEVRRPGSGPIAFGSFTFDPTSPGSLLVVPAVVVGRAGEDCWVTINGVTGEVPAHLSVSETGRFDPVDERTWMHAVARVRDQIRGGWLSKVVLARAETVHGSFDARAVASALSRLYPECFTFCFDGFVGASPELLVRRFGSVVESLVLAGSMPRGLERAEDDRLAAALLSSPKERVEHDLAVGTVRDVLALSCAELKVDDEPSLLRLANVQHLATSVRGDLAEPLTALELAGKLHPTAAVCGVPTHDALELIRSLEGFDRGRYAGPIGWVDARGDGEWAIALRCAEVSDGEARLFAGSGIVGDSDPESELAETKIKLRAVRSAMGLA
jgi:menaquinone-specific isochorismate synthase